MKIEELQKRVANKTISNTNYLKISMSQTLKQVDIFMKYYILNQVNGFLLLMWLLMLCSKVKYHNSYFKGYFNFRITYFIIICIKIPFQICKNGFLVKIAVASFTFGMKKPTMIYSFFSGKNGFDVP